MGKYCRYFVKHCVFSVSKCKSSLYKMSLQLFYQVFLCVSLWLCHVYITNLHNNNRWFKKKKSVDINGANFHERFILISTKTVLYDEMREHMLFWERVFVLTSFFISIACYILFLVHLWESLIFPEDALDGNYIIYLMYSEDKSFIRCITLFAFYIG